MDARTFRLQILEALRRAVSFDAHAWLLTDPQTAVGAAPVADVPWMAELPRQIRLKYCTAVNRWTALADRPVALLHEATGGDLAQSLVWRDLLARHGVHDVASVVFADRFGCWAFLELWRSETVDRFTRAEAEFLADLVKPVTLALRRCQASTFITRPARELRVGPVVLVLSPELLVRGQTPETSEYLRTLIPPVPSAAGPGGRLQRRRSAACDRGRRRQQHAQRTSPRGKRPVDDRARGPARRPRTIARARHRRDARGKLGRRASRRLRSVVRSYAPRARVS